MKITTLIADEDLRERGHFEQLLRTLYPFFGEILLAGSCEQLLKTIDAARPELVFSGMEFGGQKAQDIFHRLRHEDFTPVFMTDQAYFLDHQEDFSDLDYMIRPVPELQLTSLIDPIVRAKLIRMRSASEGKGLQRVALPAANGFEFHNIETIIRCEASSNYTTVHFAGGKKAVVSRTLKEYEELLHQHGFLRIHKSHLVNIRHLVRYVNGDGGIAVMHDGAEVPVSRRLRPDMMKILNRWVYF